jgi:hypothetical protein
MMSFRITGNVRPAKKLPPLTKKAVNLLQASAAVAKHAAMTGIIDAGSDEAKRRLDICRACSEWYVAENDRCAHPKCGCFLRIKTRLRAMRCPDGKW